MSRRPFIAANWKMNKTVSEAVSFVEAFLPLVISVSDADIVIAPTFISLSSMASKLKGTNVLLSAQNCFYEEKGAFTGEVSPVQLKDLGCDYVIIGHSERRQFFSDTDDVVNKKIKSALKNGLKVIMCIGETLAERNGNQTFDVLKRQIVGGLKDVELKDIVVAYEPVWAIGTGVTATPEQAQEAHRFIRSEIKSLYGEGASEAVRILYGGSVTPETVDSLMLLADVDGALVGGASMKPESFSKIVGFKRFGG